MNQLNLAPECNRCLPSYAILQTLKNFRSKKKKKKKKFFCFNCIFFVNTTEMQTLNSVKKAARSIRDVKQTLSNERRALSLKTEKNSSR